MFTIGLRLPENMKCESKVALLAACSIEALCDAVIAFGTLLANRDLFRCCHLSKLFAIDHVVHSIVWCCHVSTMSGLTNEGISPVAKSRIEFGTFLSASRYLIC